MFTCIMPSTWNEINNNYLNASKLYESKRKAILERLEMENKISGEEFVRTLQANYQEVFERKYKSDRSTKTVKLKTVLQQVYDAAVKIAQQTLENNQMDIDTHIEKLKEISQENRKNINQEQKTIAKELNNIVKQYEMETQIDQLINERLPSFMSEGNKQLSASQIYAYTKSVLKNMIREKAGISSVEKVIQRKSATVIGFIREDAIAQAALLTIEKLKANSVDAKVIGKHQSKIDILIPVSSRAKKVVSEEDHLKSIIEQLDVIGQSFVVNGESKYNNEEFLGVQAKPWNLNSKTYAGKPPMSLGHSASLLKDFQLENIVSSVPNDLIGWHKNVLFLSQRLEQAIGPNTVMYALGQNMTWTSDLLEDLVKTYHKYFAFVLDSSGKPTAHISLQDHYG